VGFNTPQLAAGIFYSLKENMDSFGKYIFKNEMAQYVPWAGAVRIKTIQKQNISCRTGESIYLYYEQYQ
jgi:hypothetical protein